VNRFHPVPTSCFGVPGRLTVSSHVDVHWVRDGTYDEDRSQLRAGTGPQVMAALRNAAIGALRLAGAANIAAANRHYARHLNRPLALLGIT
jgi:hypothetical protein